MGRPHLIAWKQSYEGVSIPKLSNKGVKSSSDLLRREGLQLNRTVLLTAWGVLPSPTGTVCSEATDSCSGVIKKENILHKPLR